MFRQALGIDLMAAKMFVRNTGTKMYVKFKNQADTSQVMQ